MIIRTIIIVILYSRLQTSYGNADHDSVIF